MIKRELRALFDQPPLSSCFMKAPICGAPIGSHLAAIRVWLFLEGPPDLQTYLLLLAALCYTSIFAAVGGVSLLRHKIFPWAPLNMQLRGMPTWTNAIVGGGEERLDIALEGFMTLNASSTYSFTAHPDAVDKVCADFVEISSGHSGMCGILSGYTLTNCGQVFEVSYYHFNKIAIQSSAIRIWTWHANWRFEAKTRHICVPPEIIFNSNFFLFSGGPIPSAAVRRFTASVQSRHTYPISESSGYYGEIKHTAGNMPLGTGHQLPVEHEQEALLVLLETCVVSVLKDTVPPMTGIYERCRDSWRRYPSFLDLPGVNNYSKSDKSAKTGNGTHHLTMLTTAMVSFWSPHGRIRQKKASSQV